MRAIWKGSISFGLVNIPIALFPATRKDEIHFRQLRGSDLSPINYKRVAENDGREVPWEEIVKGFEYEKGQFVVMKEDDFDKVELKSTQTIEILDFVDLDQIDPMYFDKPYYLEPQKGGKKAYALLRDTLEETNKVGIAKVVIKTRQHLAAVKPKGDALVLELMHFSQELLEPKNLDLPHDESVGKREKEMAKALVESMTDKWQPQKYHDEYRDALMKLIEQKVESGGKEIPTKPKARQATNVVDLVEVLKRSLAETTAGKKRASKSTPEKRKKAA